MSSTTWPGLGRWRRRGVQVLALATLLAQATDVRAQDSLDALRAVVDDACRCAASRASGIDAAVSCTDGPAAFGRLKVAARAGWSAAERAEAGVLERTIETCIANALDHATARRRLGLAVTPGPTGVAPVVWTQVRVADIAAHPNKLARLHAVSGAPRKGLVAAVTDGAVILRRARRDGGGSERIPLDQIREAWVMTLP